VASNPTCPPQILGRLVRDREWLVREAAAANPALPEQWRTLAAL